MHQTVRRAPNQRCFERRSDAIRVPVLHTYLEGTRLVDLLPVDASHKASTGPQSHPHVPRVPHGLYFADVDHVSVLMASHAENHVGLGPLAPFANVPSERHRSAPHDRCAHSCPSLPLGKPRPPGGAGIDNECYLFDPASSHMLVSKIKPCMCKYELIPTMKLRMANLV